MTSVHEKHVQLPTSWNGNSSPGTSRNEQFLFSVTKVRKCLCLCLICIELTQVSDIDNPSLKSVQSGDSETSAKKLTAGMLVTEGDDANEDGDGDDGGECDGDIFDAEGW